MERRNYLDSLQGMAFTLPERQVLGIHGLLPPVVLTQEEQLYRTMQSFTRQPNDLEKYILLAGLQVRWIWLLGLNLHVGRSWFYKKQSGF